MEARCCAYPQGSKYVSNATFGPKVCKYYPLGALWIPGYYVARKTWSKTLDHGEIWGILESMNPNSTCSLHVPRQTDFMQPNQVKKQLLLLLKVF